MLGGARIRATQGQRLGIRNQMGRLPARHPCGAHKGTDTDPRWPRLDDAVFVDQAANDPQSGAAASLVK